MLMHEKPCLIPIVKYGETFYGRQTALTVTVVKMDNSEKELTMIKSFETVYPLWLPRPATVIYSDREFVPSINLLTGG